jgi:Ca-activated chloride channel family protein
MKRWIFAALAMLAIAFVSKSALADGALYLAKGGGEFPLKRTDVQARVTGNVVSATVTQTFTNPNKERIEAVYVFPLPNRSAVDDMEMKIGARVIKAQIAKRAEAKAAYENAVREGQHAALLEQERPNVFTFSVGNIDPGTDIQVRLHYFEEAQFDAGTYEMVVPTTVGPRYNPASVTDANRISTPYAKRTGATIGISVRLDPGMDIEKIESPWHETDIAKSNNQSADIKLKNLAEIPNRDFVLRWRIAATACKTSFFAYKPTPSQPGYLSVFLEPRHDAPDGEIMPRELFFLLDTSGSMQGTPLQTVKAAIRKAIDSLYANDTFQIIDFADTASTFSPRPLAATAENRKRGLAYLENLRAAGGTNQLAGIHAALTSPGDAGRVRYVVFMTDGYIGNEREVAALAKRELGSAHIYSFGIGSSVNRYLLDEVAIAGRGKAEYLGPNENATAMVDRFYQRIGRPYLTDIQIDWGGIQTQEMEPVMIPDLSAFEPLVIHARYNGKPEGTITVRGRVAGKPYEQAFKLALGESDPEHSPLERLWARARIAGMEHAEHVQGTLADNITGLALEHRLLTQYTAFVAIDTMSGGNAAAMRMQQPNEAPFGVNLNAAGGQYVNGSAQYGAGGAGSTTTVMSAPPPAPPRDEASFSGADSAEIEAVHARGGCAGCSTSAASGSWPLALLALFLLRRRR